MTKAPLKTVVKIDGMHCASCDILVKSKLEGNQSIIHVAPDKKRSQLTITHTNALSLDDVNSLLCEYGYKVTDLDEAIVQPEENTLIKNVKDAAAYSVLIGAFYYITKDLGLIPNIMADPTSGFFGAFVLGIIASVSTCMATTGALLAGYTHLTKDKSLVFGQTILFIIGRLAGYAIFGFTVGLFGSFFAGLAKFDGIINIIVVSILIVVALDMLRILPLSTVLDWFPMLNNLKNRISSNASKTSSMWGALILGISTYFLPCGFSLSTQAYAISLNNPFLSAGTMFTFALGTIPALFAFGIISKIRRTKAYFHLNKVIGVLVLALAISYILNTLTLYGISIDVGNKSVDTGSSAPIKNGKQIVKMTATSSGYSPNSFVVKKDIPVRWEIDGEQIFGCQGAIQSPKAGVKLTYLKPGENVIEFIPTETGTIQFSCSMGMFGGKFTVI